MAVHNCMSRRLQTVPGVGPVTAVAIEAFAPNMECFDNGRSFAAWLGLVPRQYSTGGRQVLGRTSKMGHKDISRLLIIGAMARIGINHRLKRTVEPWLQDKLDRKPRMVAAIALANKMAWQIWAMLIKGEDYKIPADVAVAQRRTFSGCPKCEEVLNRMGN